MFRKSRPFVFCSLLLAIVVSGCGQKNDLEYQTEIDDWHANRVERLRSETGWLTLVGLHPLGPGNNTLGSAADNDVVMDAVAPARLGTLNLIGGRTEFTPEPGLEIHLFQDGVVSAEPFTGGTIQTDSDGAPDMLASGSLVFYAIQRGEKFFVRVKDRQSKTLQNFHGIDRYPVAKKWRVTAKLEGEPGTVRVANVLGQVAAEPTPGILVFELEGQTCRLKPTGDPAEGLFVVFGDATNGQGTYPGGRFLATGPVTSDGTVVLDFNKAYNPPCVFTAFATCPLPGADSRLPVAVAAGETMWGTGH